MFNTKGQETKNTGGSKSLEAGVVKAHIHSGSVKTSSKGDKKVLELILEGDAPAGFEGWPIDKDKPEGAKYQGPSARVVATSWTDQFDKNDLTKNDILNKLTIMANELNKRDDIDAIQASSIEEWASKAIAILKGQDLYFFLKGEEQEYNGKTITKLSLPRYKFCSTFEDRLDKFDKTNKYHYKALPPKEPVENFDADVPFDDLSL